MGLVPLNLLETCLQFILQLEQLPLERVDLFCKFTRIVVEDHAGELGMVVVLGGGPIGRQEELRG